MSTKSVRHVSAVVNGLRIDGDELHHIEIANPATNEPVATVPSLNSQDVARAIDGAANASNLWANLVPDARYQILKNLASLILKHNDELSELVTEECGKPLSEAAGEVSLAAAYIEWSAEEARRLEGQLLASSAMGKRLMVQPRPVGVVGAVTPWNFPVALVARKIGPALAAGCPVLLKPSEKAPLGAIRLAELALDAGAPSGVLNVITGDAEGITNALLDSRKVKMISFTGSTKVGRWLVERSARTLTRLNLELGGNAPFIVADDADIEKAIQDALVIKFRNAGQTCVAANRFLIHASVYDGFVDEFVARAGRLTLGPGRDSRSDLGPLIDESAVVKVQAHVDDAVDNGAKVLLGGIRSPTPEPGFYYPPTVLDGWTSNMLISQSEIFGPVAAFRSFSEIDEAIDVANESDAGLAGYVYTNSPARGFDFFDRLECGIIGLNDVNTAAPQVPLGGIKSSGWGREGGRWSLHEYLDTKYLDWAF